MVAAEVAEVAGAKEGMAAAVAREGMVSKETASLAYLIIIVEVLGALEHLGAEILRTTHSLRCPAWCRPNAPRRYRLPLCASVRQPSATCHRS